MSPALSIVTFVLLTSVRSSKALAIGGGDLTIRTSGLPMPRPGTHRQW
ncbi:MAG: hypothetical protein QOG95_3675 [Mycobacterium sp.]|jgi:hypothetical protein|nr:hypothetical protein [Mycobacterium sp.]